MTDIISLCKRRGFIFPSSEIYGGLASAWDYGPLGVELKNNIQNLWWREMTQLHENIVGLDAAILMHPRVWEASGHVENFVDMMSEDQVTHERHRWDHLTEEQRAQRKSPKGNPLSEPRRFNLMFETHMGPVVDSASRVYLRPETAQGIYVNYKNILKTSRLKIPFGIAQVGKAFRNEITTKNFIFRTCEFEQMEMQFFVAPESDVQWFQHWKDQRMQYYQKMGIVESSLRMHQHGPEELAHYARDAYDVEYEFPFGWSEVEGIHNRGDYDLRRHAEFSQKDMRYVDPQSSEKFHPYIIETSAGLTRSVLMVLCDAYEEEVLGSGEKRILMKFHPGLAPFTVGVFPLVKKDGLSELAATVAQTLRTRYRVFYDAAGAIGRRYRRQDEIGTPYGITVDYQSKDDKTVTLRFRDSMEQKRVNISQLIEAIDHDMAHYKRIV